MNKQQIFIRDFQESDYNDVMHVWTESGVGGAHRGDNLQTIQNTIERGGKLFVMFFGDELIGTSWISNDGRRLFLQYFGILPQYQGRGYSKPLLEASLHYARKLNMQIKLEVHEKNTHAIQLYENSGFARLGDYDIYIIRKH